MKKYNISYKLEKWTNFGKITQFDDGGMNLTITEDNLKLLITNLSNITTNKIKEYNGKKYYTLNIFEDDGKYTKEQNNNNVTLKSDDFVPF